MNALQIDFGRFLQKNAKKKVLVFTYMQLFMHDI